ncbi:MAG: hypothetical protein PHC69_11160, partial [Ruminiclostridium sp.]|nr:hypothetical protein [Ruminiclostridium sp.]
MGRLFEYTKKMMNDIRATFTRFASVPLLLTAITILVSMLIENAFSESNRQIIERIIFSLIAGVLFGVALEFLCERFDKLIKYRIVLQLITPVFSLIYYLLLPSDSKTEFVTIIRL